jgi:hypothetical protein
VSTCMGEMGRIFSLSLLEKERDSVEEEEDVVEEASERSGDEEAGSVSRDK